MDINIEPLNYRVLVLPEPRKEQTEGGILIPETARENMVDLRWGTIKRVSRKITELSEGQRVQYPATAGKEEEINGTKYRSIQDSDIWHMEVPVDSKNPL